MKVYYFSPFDILRPRTNQISDMRLCEGFAENGCDVELIVPYCYRRDNISRDIIFDYLASRLLFELKYLELFFRMELATLLN